MAIPGADLLQLYGMTQREQRQDGEYHKHSEGFGRIHGEGFNGDSKRLGG